MANSSTPLFTTVVLAIVPRVVIPSPPKRSVPPLIVVVPVYVLLATSVSVPVPVLVSDNGPPPLPSVKMPLKESLRAPEMLTVSDAAVGLAF